MTATVSSFLRDRRAKLTIGLPVATDGDYRNVQATDQLEINGIDDSSAAGLKIKFKIVKTLEKEPNASELTISNLNPTHRSALQQKNVKVFLDAGYSSSGIARLFAGDVRTCDHVREGANWETKIKCHDGGRAFRVAMVSESWSGVTLASDVVKRLANLSGLGMGNVVSAMSSVTTRFEAGYSATGKWQQEMDRIIKALGLTWSIQDQAIQILTDDGTYTAEIPLISPDTGLIGSPEMGSADKAGKPALCKFKTLLMPVRPGGKVRLKSERYDGELKVQKVEYQGDTGVNGKDWYTEIQGRILRNG